VPVPAIIENKSYVTSSYQADTETERRQSSELTATRARISHLESEVRRVTTESSALRGSFRKALSRQSQVSEQCMLFMAKLDDVTNRLHQRMVKMATKVKSIVRARKI
jgi:hypothetical protein